MGVNRACVGASLVDAQGWHKASPYGNAGAAAANRLFPLDGGRLRWG